MTAEPGQEPRGQHGHGNTASCWLPVPTLDELYRYCATRSSSPTTVHPEWGGLWTQINLAWTQSRRDAAAGASQAEAELRLTDAQLTLLHTLQGVLPDLRGIRIVDS